MKRILRRPVVRHPSSVDPWVEEQNRSLEGRARYRVDETFGDWQPEAHRKERRKAAVTLPKIPNLDTPEDA